jgi:hypothetical protein
MHSAEHIDDAAATTYHPGTVTAPATTHPTPCTRTTPVDSLGRPVAVDHLRHRRHITVGCDRA